MSNGSDSFRLRPLLNWVILNVCLTIPSFILLTQIALKIILPEEQNGVLNSEERHFMCLSFNARLLLSFLVLQSDPHLGKKYHCHHSSECLMLILSSSYYLWLRGWGFNIHSQMWALLCLSQLLSNAFDAFLSKAAAGTLWHFHLKCDHMLEVVSC